MGGEFSADGKSFTFYSTNTGVHGFIVSNSLTKIKLTIGDKNYAVNGKSQANDVAPIIVNGRTMLSLCAIAEALGAVVGWDATTKTVSVTANGKTVEVVIGQPLLNGMGTPEIIADRTFVPVRYIAEQLGANVVWDEVSKTVAIYK